VPPSDHALRDLAHHRARSVLLVDSLVAAAVVVLDEIAIRQPWDDGTRAGSVALNAPLVALAVLPLALRRTRPVPGLALMVVALALPGLVVAHDYLFWGGFVPLVAMIFTVARDDDGLAGRGGWAVPLVLAPFESAHLPGLRSVSELTFAMVICTAAWAVGRLVQRLDLQEQQLTRALARLAEQQQRRETAAVVDERSRIAGEMHDVVAHAVSLMVLQVGAARLELETTAVSEQAAGQLRTAETAGRDALDQLRRSLAVLHGTHV
jgi:signal transduction histidine kinase